MEAGKVFVQTFLLMKRLVLVMLVGLVEEGRRVRGGHSRLATRIYFSYIRFLCSIIALAHFWHWCSGYTVDSKAWY